jgi:hypothetical protein
MQAGDMVASVLLALLMSICALTAIGL